MQQAPKAVKLAESALVQKVADEMVILDINNGQYYTLNEVAADMVAHLHEGATFNEVVVNICAQYDVKKAEVEGDLQELLTTLLDKELVYAVK